MEKEESEVKIEHRRDRRVAVKVGVTMSSDSNFFVGFTDNVSEGGLFLATYNLLPIGREVELEFRLPDEEKPIRAQAEVRWHRSVSDPGNGELVGFGARFSKVPEGDQERLKSFLSKREPIFHPE